MNERLIFHVDVNSAFLSWEATRRVKNGEPDLRLIPSCIGENPGQALAVAGGGTVIRGRRPTLISCGKNIFSQLESLRTQTLSCCEGSSETK